MWLVLKGEADTAISVFEVGFSCNEEQSEVVAVSLLLGQFLV